MPSYIKAEMFSKLKAKSQCCQADIIACMGIPLLQLVCSKCRIILNSETTSPRSISDDLFTRLSQIPEDITDLHDVIDFLIKDYYKHQNQTNAERILSSEEGVN